MTDLERLQEENRQLREQVDEFRRRELADVREQLASAKADAAHYRAEAERNAETGRQIHREAQAEIGRLRSELDATRRLSNVRVPGPGRPQ